MSDEELEVRLWTRVGWMIVAVILISVAQCESQRWHGDYDKKEQHK